MEIHPYKDISGFENQLNLPLSKIYNEGYLNGGIWFNDTATLLCGTFPPKQEYHNRKGYIHYSSPLNKLWRHIDNLYSTNLYIPTRISTVESSRIENAIRKISFLRNKKIGLVDVFTKVSRKQENSSSDSDLIPLETIFDTNTFDTILSHRNVKQIGFVYSLSRDIFEKEFSERFNVTFEIVRQYNMNGIPLEVKKASIEGKEFFLSYSPIHGKIKDELKREALRKVIEFDF